MTFAPLKVGNAQVDNQTKQQNSMIKKKTETTGPIEIDLTGPDGNAYVLLGMAARWAKDLGKDGKAIQKEATSGDYEHLLAVLDREFGEYVTFLR